MPLRSYKPTKGQQDVIMSWMIEVVDLEQQLHGMLLAAAVPQEVAPGIVAHTVLYNALNAWATLRMSHKMKAADRQAWLQYAEAMFEECLPYTEAMDRQALDG